MPYRVFLIAFSLVLAGCGDTVAEKTGKTRQQRVAETEARLNSGPVVRAHKVDGGEIKVIDTPVSGFGGLTVNIQKCFVWRDAEYKTASLSCPHQPEPAMDGADTGPADTAAY